MMKKMLKRVHGVLQVVLIGLLGCGVCTADTKNDIGKAKLLAPVGSIDTPSPVYKWATVPGAIRHCLLVSDSQGDLVYLAWYTAQEAECSSDGICSVSPSAIMEGCQWAVITCGEDDCSSCSEWTAFEAPQPAYDSSYDRYERLQQQAATWMTGSDS